MKVEFAPGFQDSMDKLFHWKYAPYRAWKWFLRIPREIQWKWQRMNRGWSDQDVWGAYYHLSRVIPGMLRNLADNHMGHPGALTDEEWTAKLRSMADKIEAYVIMSEMPDDWTMEKENEAYKITQEGLREMADWFGNLWD